MKTSVDGRVQSAPFQVVVPGTASYSAGGFNITVPAITAIKSASVFMTPETLIATTKNVGLVVTTSGAVATVKVLQRSQNALWNEVDDGTNLSGANFILTGRAL